MNIIQSSYRKNWQNFRYLIWLNLVLLKFLLIFAKLILI